jgi:hypothetical protein
VWRAQYLASFSALPVEHSSFVQPVNTFCHRIVIRVAAPLLKLAIQCHSIAVLALILTSRVKNI